MSERKFTAEERKRIAQVFRHAKNKLWNGRLDTPIGDKCVSICRAIDECGFLIGHRHAITVIHSRLGPTRPMRTLRVWLIEQGIPPGFITDHRLQEHRHAWMDMLIEEFSQP
ncbi:hypothetical protein ATN89_17045, partial [Comamonas thiooxydans]|uniref:hypothetical protein n=1 Tax=Comamonas thiooxydans TaxID=363952 RepID=UPI0007CC126E